MKLISEFGHAGLAVVEPDLAGIPETAAANNVTDGAVMKTLDCFKIHFLIPRLRAASLLVTFCCRRSRMIASSTRASTRSSGSSPRAPWPSRMRRLGLATREQ